MDVVQCRYFKLNRILLSAVGLWPYSKSKFKKVVVIFASVILISSLFPQLSVIVTEGYTLDILLQVLSTLFPCIWFLIKFEIFYFYPQKIVSVMKEIQMNWDMLKKVEEIQIIQKYSEDGRKFTVGLTILVYVGIGLYCFLQVAPNVLNISLSLNKSHWELPIKLEYFIDEDKYYNFIILHIFSTIVLGMHTILATESLFIAYTLHACGLFKLACYRFEHSIDDAILRDPSPQKNKIIQKRIIGAVDIHRQAIKFSESLWCAFEVPYFLLTLIGVLSLSITLFRLSVALSTKELREICLSTIFCFGQFVYMAVGSLYGQSLKDHSGAVFNEVYQLEWYEASWQVQKLFILILRRSMKESTFVTAGLLTVSFEGFTTLTNMSLSYFMLLNSL